MSLIFLPFLQACVRIEAKIASNLCMRGFKLGHHVMVFISILSIPVRSEVCITGCGHLVWCVG